MKFSQIFYTISTWNIFTFAFHDDLHMKPFVNSDSDILADTVTAIIVDCFKEDEIYLSIISSLTQNEKSHFLDDFIFKMFKKIALKNYPRNILNELDNSVRFKRGFNLIFISDNVSLS